MSQILFKESGNLPTFDDHNMVTHVHFVYSLYSSPPPPLLPGDRKQSPYPWLAVTSKRKVQEEGERFFFYTSRPCLTLRPRDDNSR